MKIDKPEVGCLAVEGRRIWVLLEKLHTGYWKTYCINANVIHDGYIIYDNILNLQQDFYKNELMSILYGVLGD